MNDWPFYYKIDPEYNSRVGNNLLYTPRINIEKQVMCMDWDSKSEYQNYSQRPDFTEELVSFFYERELYYLDKFKEFTWCPKILDTKPNKIFIEFSGETLNDILYTEGRNIEVEVPDYEEQVYNIVKDIVDSGYYKMSLYPHCFFVQNGVLKTFDYYACIPSSDPYLEKHRLSGMMGKDSAGRFSEATNDNLINFEVFFKRLLSHHVKWPNNLFPRIYERIFGND